ncbi:MAG: PIN domain-containing protein [Acidobacteria bacterium]|nr:PIN domain-containing protein [Acidobacteriota bacterium]
MRISLDTNVLAYAEGTNGEAMRDRAMEMVRRLPQGNICIPVQVLGELFNVLVLKAKRKRARARAAVLNWSAAYSRIETSPVVMANAIDLAADHGLSIWDSVVLSASAEAECRLLLSEDMQTGLNWNGVTVVNPFAANLHPMLVALLKASS